jgi:hypothetical protein
MCGFLSERSCNLDFKELTYTCATPSCGHKQDIRYFAADAVLPVTCCVKCRAGFGKELAEQYQSRIGMFPGPVRASA